MNEITIKQNLPKQIDKLAAQRYLYSKAKIIFYIRITFSLALAVLAPILISQFSSTQYYVSVVIIFYLLIDIIFLQRAENNHKKDAAKIQENFDLEVFGLDWNSIVVDNKIDEEKIIKYADLYRAKNKEKIDKLQNWYSTEIANLGLVPAIAVCQRTNIYWDVSLRKNIFWAMIGVLIVSFIAIFFINSEPILLICSAIPFYKVVTEYAISQHSTINRIENLKNKIESFLDDRSNFTYEQINKLRSIQDQIFTHRTTSAFVPDWLYWLNRNNQEKEMNYGASYYVDQILKKSASSKP